MIVTGMVAGLRGGRPSARNQRLGRVHITVYGDLSPYSATRLSSVHRRLTGITRADLPDTAAIRQFPTVSTASTQDERGVAQNLSTGPCTAALGHCTGLA